MSAISDNDQQFLSRNQSRQLSIMSDPRKRKRSDSPEVAPGEEGHKSRRVDPSRLAMRLDPDLVKEMDKYIVPGAIMPSFTIRKELQQRYAVDRRHLYDYFHSRGLRVAKEDKFNNLTRSRMQKSQAENSENSEPLPKKVVKPRKLPKLPKSSNSTKASSKDNVNSFTMYASPRVPFKASHNVSPNHGHPITTKLPSSALSSPPSPIQLVSPQEPVEPIEHDYDISYTPQWMLEYSGIFETPAVPSLSLFPPSLLRSVSSSSEWSCTCSMPDESVSREARTSFVNLVERSIGPAQGFQESAGSYKTYLDNLKRRHYAPVTNNNLCGNSPIIMSVCPNQTVVAPIDDKAYDISYDADFSTYDISLDSFSTSGDTSTFHSDESANIKAAMNNCSTSFYPLDSITVPSHSSFPMHYSTPLQPTPFTSSDSHDYVSSYPSRPGKAVAPREDKACLMRPPFSRAPTQFVMPARFRTASAGGGI